MRNLYVDTKKTYLRYLEAKLWHIALKWRPFLILTSSGKRTRRNSGDFNYVGHVGFNTPEWCFYVHCKPSRDVKLWDFHYFWRPFCVWILSRKNTKYSLAWGRFGISAPKLCKNNCMPNSTKKCLTKSEISKIGPDYNININLYICRQFYMVYSSYSKHWYTRIWLTFLWKTPAVGAECV